VISCLCAREGIIYGSVNVKTISNPLTAKLKIVFKKEKEKDILLLYFFE